MDAPRFIDAATIAAMPYARARELLEQALRSIDPAADPPRTSYRHGDAEFLLMPSVAGGAGTKLLSSYPDNPGRGRPRIQGLYVLFDTDTGAPQAVLDGIALTLLRTAAVSQLGFAHLAPDEVDTVAVFGTGPQAYAHLSALAEVRPFRTALIGGRTHAKATDCAAKASAELGITAGALPEPPAERAAAVRDAQVVVCVTSAHEPVVDDEWISDGALTVAVGTHQPDHRELPGALLGRSAVVVEDVATALREAGDVVLAIDEGRLRADDLIDLRALFGADTDAATAGTTGTATTASPRGTGSYVFKTVGMAWQDLAIARGLAGSPVTVA